MFSINITYQTFASHCHDGVITFSYDLYFLIMIGLPSSFHLVAEDLYEDAVLLITLINRIDVKVTSSHVNNVIV
ncbi:hypothetical protein DICVIV_08379 [Dictyocaulus viviparus]|uniref:Uncharacterized protein n=1 Tax=Dictyocaulus viviparus TaxID=29172 RepID=A0A0D8XM07_DICVI|nr:hypothetical protein DICVIV_08379 [Dictyocaulus viviparus]